MPELELLREEYDKTSFHVPALAGEHPTSAVDVEARVNPASQHPGPLGRQQPLVD